MDWKDTTGVVAKLAPMIATGLGGPLAGGAIAALENVFGIDTQGASEDKQGALVAAISGATPDQLLALKKADQEYALQMQALGFKSVQDLEALAVSDRESARHREETVLDNTPKILAYLLTLGFFLVLGFMLFGNPPMASRDILNILMGVLGTAFTGVINYYFGSSSGSAAKTALLAKSPAIVE